MKSKTSEGCILAATNKTPAPQTRKTTCGQSTSWCNVLHFRPSHHPSIPTYSIVPRHWPTSCRLQYGKAGAVFRTARDKTWLEPGNDVRYSVYTGSLHPRCLWDIRQRKLHFGEFATWSWTFSLRVNIVRQTHLFSSVVLKACLLKNTALFHYKKYSMKHAIEHHAF